MGKMELKLDHAQYVVIYSSIEESRELIDYKSIKIGGNNITFVPLYDFKNLIGKYNILLFSWKIVKAALIKLIDDEWTYKIENDRDELEMEEIGETENNPIKRLDKIENYFQAHYKWPDDIPDPILHSRLLITPPMSNFAIIIYYGGTIEFQNNKLEDIKYLFKIIWEEYSKYKTK